MPKTEKNKNAQCVSDLKSRALATTYIYRAISRIWTCQGSSSQKRHNSGRTWPVNKAKR